MHTFSEKGYREHGKEKIAKRFSLSLSFKKTGAYDFTLFFSTLSFLIKPTLDHVLQRFQVRHHCLLVIDSTSTPM
jgi:hypothetical protein